PGSRLGCPVCFIFDEKFALRRRRGCPARAAPGPFPEKGLDQKGTRGIPPLSIPHVRRCPASPGAGLQRVSKRASMEAFFAYFLSRKKVGCGGDGCMLQCCMR